MASDEGGRIAQLRVARTCYDHLAGRLGVSVMAAMIERGHLTGGDGSHDPEHRVAGHGRDVEYALTEQGWAFLDEIEVRVPQDSRRRLMRHCVDWSEQRHHLAGLLGRSVLERFLAAEWVRRREGGRSIRVTPAGAEVLAEQFHIAWE